MPRVLFATKCWQGDWQRVLGGFEAKVRAIGYPFESTLAVINNADDPDSVRDAFEGVADRVVVAESSLPWIYGQAGLSRESFVTPGGDGYPYAIGELAAVLHAASYDYLCYVQGDALARGDWVTPGIKVLEDEPGVMVVSPASDVNTWHDAAGYDRYMSDHAWLVRPWEFQDKAVYAVPGADPDYPAYGGNSFEAMVGRYLKATGRTRKVLTRFRSLHPVS